MITEIVSTTLHLYATPALAVGGAMLLLWLLSVVIQNVGIVDVFWGPGFAAVALLTYIRLESPAPAASLLLLMTLLWAFRLATHILTRNAGKPEDRRYGAMRTHYGESFWLVSSWLVFGLQGALMLLIAAPVIIAIHFGRSLTPVAYLGVAIWLAGFIIEAMADAQLLRFKQRKKGRTRVCKTGLWKHSRHPNYFGEIVLWWGYFLVAAGTTGFWWLAFSPLLMTFLLVKVSGVALLDRTLSQSNPEYRKYLRQTNALLPWRRRRS